MPAHTDTSATLAGLYPFLAEGGLGSAGVYVGQDPYSGSSFVFDPWVFYERLLISAPNMVVAGIVGAGKSASAKSLYTPSIAFGRRVHVAADPKGEHSRVAELVGGKVIVLGRGLSTRLNPLDDRPRVPGLSGEDWRQLVASRRCDLVGALAETVLSAEAALTGVSGARRGLRVLSSRRAPGPIIGAVAKISDEDTLRRFVLRARRIEAHSLVRDWDQLMLYAGGRFEVLVDISGKISLTRRLPDEEIFESLVARLRPLTVDREPIHHKKVFDVLERLAGGVEVAEPLRADLERLRTAWAAADLQGTTTQAYAMQSMTLDGSGATPLVSDTQLASAWLYADLVHADPVGPKVEALAFPLRERFAAALRLFSHLAALTVGTLRAIESLRAKGVLAIDESAWEEEVVIAASELVNEGQTFFGASGALLPGTDEQFELDDQWTRITVTEAARLDPGNQVRVVLEDDDRIVVAAYDSAVIHRDSQETALGWNVLVANAVEFHFRFGRDGEQLTDPTLIGWEPHTETNELGLASALLYLQMHRAVTMRFEVAGTTFLALTTPKLTETRLREIEVFAEMTGDIVAIERLSGHAVEPGDGRFDDQDRVKLRRARLMWEGHVSHGVRQGAIVTVPTGRPPQAVQVAAGELDIGGARVPTLTWLMWHPGMSSTEVGDAPEAGEGAKRYRVAPPDGEQFFAWAPQTVHPAADDDLTVTASWDLIGIDEETSPL